MPLTRAHIPAWRLHAQSLYTPRFTDPAAAVFSHGAVQAQDYAGAKWALGMRLSQPSEAQIDDAHDRGEIVRTHVLRPTWHFVTPADVRWMLALTGPRIVSSLQSRQRALELDARTLARAHTALQRALEGGRALDRAGVRAILARAKVKAADSERFSHILIVAEAQALVCSGPRQGGQFTYALMDERVPPTPVRDRDDAVRELVNRYFTSHGPATLHDFAVWSGLNLGDARRGLDAQPTGAFVETVVDGLGWWHPAGAEPRPVRGSRAWLLPNFDEYFIGFKHRTPLLARVHEHGAPMDAREFLSHILCVDGQVVGGWKRVVSRNSVGVALSPVVPLSRAEQRAVEGEVARYGRFLGLAVEPAWVR